MNTAQQARLMQILLSPKATEKATLLADKHRQFVFKVVNDANKDEIKNAVEFLFNVKVLAVQTLNVKGKHKRLGKTPGKRSDWKKAYVCLQEGYDIVLGGQ
jgi:large subunit ribosomal protein L23